MVHVLGFLGSGFIITSATMRRVVWLRTFGMLGSLTFIAYGVLLGAWPVVLTNVMTTSLHLLRLRAGRSNPESAVAALPRPIAGPTVRPTVLPNLPPPMPPHLRAVINAGRQSRSFIAAIQTSLARSRRPSAAASSPISSAVSASSSSRLAATVKLPAMCTRSVSVSRSGPG